MLSVLDRFPPGWRRHCKVFEFRSLCAGAKGLGKNHRTLSSIDSDKGLLMRESSFNAKPMNILFFTVHKAASMFIYKICHDLAKEAGLKYYSINHNRRSRYYFDTEETDLRDLSIWGDRRGCFAPLRFFFEIPAELDSIRSTFHQFMAVILGTMTIFLVGVLLSRREAPRQA